MTESVTATIASCLDTIASNRTGRVLKRDYRASGTYPIVDQGKGMIAGWTDDDSGLISVDLPLVVFGDHTRTFKYVEFPFVRGADGTQLLKPKDWIDPLYFYFACKALNLPSRGYNRHFKLLKEMEIRTPSLPDQREIGRILQQVEDGILRQDRQIETTLDLKRSAMHTLFTRGLCSEHQKETEIGMVPESWGVRPIDDLAHQLQYGLSVRGEKSGRYPILRMNCQQDGKVVMRDLQYVNIDEETAETYRVHLGDILFNRTNSYELVGRTAIVETTTNAVFASYLVRVLVDKEHLDPPFLNHYLNWDDAQSRLKQLASRAVGQSNISAGKLRTFRIPVPSMNEQHEIVDILNAIDSKIDLHRRKRALLEELFKALLHGLMTGEIGVDV